MTTAENYLQDVLHLLIERAQEAASEAKAAKTSGAKDDQLFQDGRALAYYEVVSTMIGQAEVFGLSASTIPELGFDPQSLLQ